MNLDDIVFLIMLALFIPGCPPSLRMFGIIVVECSNAPVAPPIKQTLSTQSPN